MGEKVTIDPLTNPNSSSFILTLNANLQALADALDNVVMKSGAEMLGPLNMNSKRQLNLPAPASPNEPVRLRDLLDAMPLPDSDVDLTLRLDLASPDGGDLISTQQSADGSVVRTLKDKLNERVSVTDFGASGNDSTINDAAIAAALAALPTGGELVFPAGIFRISVPIANSVQGVKLVGAGKKRTIIKQTSPGAGILINTGDHLQLSDIGFDYSVTPTEGATALYTSGSFGSFTDFQITKCNVGVEVVNGVANKFSRFDIRAYKAIGIHCFNMNDAFFSQFILDAENSTNGAQGGIRLANKVEAVNFTDGDIIRGAYGMVCDAATFNPRERPAACSFTGILFDSALNGVLLAKAVDFDFNACWFSFSGYNEGGAAIAASNVTMHLTDAIRFNGGRSVNAHKHGFDVGPNCASTLFNGVAIRENSLIAGNTYSGIYFAAGTSGFTVTGCQIGSTNTLYSVGAQQKYGIEIADGGGDFYVIKDNTILGNGTKAIYNGATGTNRIVDHNIGHMTSKRGAGVIPAGQNTAVITHGLNDTPSITDIIVSATQSMAAAGVSQMWVSAVTSTNFTVTTNAAPSSDLYFAWDARTRGA